MDEGLLCSKAVTIPAPIVIALKSMLNYIADRIMCFVNISVLTKVVCQMYFYPNVMDGLSKSLCNNNS